MSKADRLYIVALETVHSDDTTIFFEADGRLVDRLYAIMQVTPKGAGIVDNCYRSVAEARAAWPDAISPEAPTIDDVRGVVYLIGDQPVTCPKCGARTLFDDEADGSQKHECLACAFEFVAVEDDEDIHPLALNGRT